MGENTQNKKIAIIIMASGYSERFGSNKLLESFLDKPLFTYTVDLVASCQAEMKIIATRYEPVIQYVKENVPSMSIVWNAHPERGISESIHLEGIHMCATKKREGNPVIFPKQLFDELMALTGDKGGKRVARQHPELVHKVYVSEKELSDMDYKEDKINLEKEHNKHNMR